MGGQAKLSRRTKGVYKVVSAVEAVQATNIYSLQGIFPGGKRRCRVADNE